MQEKLRAKHLHRNRSLIKNSSPDLKIYNWTKYTEDNSYSRAETGPWGEFIDYHNLLRPSGKLLKFNESQNFHHLSPWSWIFSTICGQFFLEQQKAQIPGELSRVNSALLNSNGSFSAANFQLNSNKWMWLKPSTTLIKGVETDLQTVEMLLEGVKNDTTVTTDLLQQKIRITKKDSPEVIYK